MTKRNFLAFMLSLIVATGFSQTHFSTEKGAFLRELNDYLVSNTPKAEAEAVTLLTNDFSSCWNASYGTADAALVIDLCERAMARADARTYTGVRAFVETLTALPRSGMTQNDIRNWLTHTKLRHEKSMSKFSSYMESCRNLFKNGVLAGRGNSNWVLRKASYGFPSENTFDLDVKSGSLILITQNDSSMVHNTKGVYHFDAQTWEGEGGKTDWSRFNVADNEVYAVLPKRYQIDLSKSEYAIDSVLFYNKKYYDKPILSRFEDKVSNSKPNEKTPYPISRPYSAHYRIENMFLHVNFEGGMGMVGKRMEVFGDEGRKARFTFIRNHKPMASVQALRMVLNDDFLVSNSCHACIYMYDTASGGNTIDSIYHNDLGFRYDNDKHRLILYRSESGFGDGPFHDSFHKMDIFLEAVYWDLNSDLIEFRRMEGASTTSEGELVSANYFRKSDYNQLQSLDGLHPMVRIEKYLKDYGNPDHPNRFNVNDLAMYLQYPVEQVITMVLRLQSEGYVEYNQEDRSVDVMQRFYDVIESNRENIDFDVFKIRTVTTNRQPNLRLDMKTNDLIVHGITNPVEGMEGASIILSDRKRVVILPDNARITLKKDRNFRFSGGVMAGMLEFFTKDCLFYYDDFYIKMSKVDSLRMYARENGKVYPVEGMLERLKGRLMIDKGDNKSSKEDYAEYPIFYSDYDSYKFYRHINGGVFDPHIENDTMMDSSQLEGKFYYLLSPFVADSLNDLAMKQVRFDGKLVSGGIFPDIAEPLAVMEDHSLGFEHQIGASTEASYPMFGDKGRFHEHVHLSEDGFYGNGQLDYQTADFASDRFMFYLDSVTATTKAFKMRESATGVSFPTASCDVLDLKWDVNKPQLTTRTLENPIALYDSTLFRGATYLSPEGYAADGTLTFGSTKFDSRYFDFGYHSFKADSADFTLYSDATEAFLASNYKVFVNFDTQKVRYDYLDAKSNLAFPFNQYLCTLKEAEWDMRSNNIHVYSSGGSFDAYAKAKTMNELLAVKSGASKFISSHSEQDSLEFYCTDADYDMNTYSIRAHDVKIIRVADAAVFPSDGNVNISQNAEIGQLMYASLLADTADRYHLFKDATVAIRGRKNYNATGYMDYTAVDGVVTPIYFDTIVPVNGVTKGMAHVADTAEFLLSPQFGFTGRVVADSREQYCRFDGNFRMIHACDENSNWFASTASVNPADVKIPIVMEKINARQPRLCNGLYCENNAGSRFSASLMAMSLVDVLPVVPVNGMLSYDSISERFLVVDESKPDTYIELSDRCTVKGHGTFNLGFDTGLADFVCNGSYTDYPGDTLMLNVLNIFNAPIFDDKIMADMAEVYANAEGESIDLTATNFVSYLRSQCSDKEAEALSRDIELEGYPGIKSSDLYNRTLVIPSLAMVWNNRLNAFVSVGKIGIGNIGKNVVNKYVDGCVVFDRRLGTITYFLQNDMFMTYLSYNCGDRQLQVHATWGDVNIRLADMKEKNRTLSQNDDTFNYVVTPYEALTNFLSILRRAGVR